MGDETRYGSNVVPDFPLAGFQSVRAFRVGLLAGLQLGLAGTQFLLAGFQRSEALVGNSDEFGQKGLQPAVGGGSVLGEPYGEIQQICG